MKSLSTLLAVALISAPISLSKAQDTNTLEIIKQLQRRIDELEQKVKALEQSKPPPPPEEKTKQQVEELDKKIKDLEQQHAHDQAAVEAKEKSTPKIFMTDQGFASFGISSPDKDFIFRAGGYVQVDSRFYFGDNIPNNDTFLIRRMRPLIEGTVFRDYDYRVLLDIASHSSTTPANDAFLQDAFVNAHYWPQFQIQAGKFKPPIGYEHLVSDANLLLLERAYPSELVPNREVGFQLHGQFLTNQVAYQVGVFNGVFDGGSEDYDVADDYKDFFGRLTAQPFKFSDNQFIKGFGLGAGASIGNQRGPLASYVTTAQEKFFSYASGSGATNSPNVVADGRHWRVAPEVQYTFKSFGIFGEYALSSQVLQRTAGPDISEITAANQAWNVTASYILTGEPNTLRGVAPENPLTLHNRGWGSFEVVARVTELRVDDDVFPLYAAPNSARSALSFGGGLNWYLNRNIKLNFDYEQTRFQGGSQTPGTVTAKDEKAFMTRVQFGF